MSRLTTHVATKLSAVQKLKIVRQPFPR